MNKMVKRVVVICALLAFSVAAVVVAAEFYVVKDAAGKVSVVDKKPDDAQSIVKGPFPTKDEADKAAKAASAQKKPAAPPAEGC